MNIRTTRRSIIIDFDNKVTETDMQEVKQSITGFKDLVQTIKILATHGYTEETQPIVREVLKLWGGGAA